MEKIKGTCRLPHRIFPDRDEYAELSEDDAQGIYLIRVYNFKTMSLEFTTRYYTKTEADKAFSFLIETRNKRNY